MNEMLKLSLYFWVGRSFVLLSGIVRDPESPMYDLLTLVRDQEKWETSNPPPLGKGERRRQHQDWEGQGAKLVIPMCKKKTNLVGNELHRMRHPGGCDSLVFTFRFLCSLGLTRTCLNVTVMCLTTSLSRKRPVHHAASSRSRPKPRL